MNESALVVAGADRLLTEYAELIRGKRLGLVTNHSGRLSNGIHLVDALYGHRQARLDVLFGNDHALLGVAENVCWMGGRLKPQE